MQILNRLTIRNLKLNKKRTIVTIIGIILATSLLTAVAAMAVSLKESITLRAKKVDGDFHLLLYDMTDKEKESIINNRQVESYYEMHEVGYAVLDGCVNDSKPYVYIEALDGDTFEKAEINVTSGRLPEDDEADRRRALRACGHQDQGSRTTHLRCDCRAIPGRSPLLASARTTKNPPRPD